MAFLRDFMKIIKALCSGCNDLCLTEYKNHISSTFLLFQLHSHTLPYPKTKEKQKITRDTKLTTTYSNA